MRCGSTVLVAEDDSELRKLIAGLLDAEGYEVMQAGDGRDLLHRLQEVARETDGRESLACIICDVRMPELDGLDALAALRSARWYTPVILITAFGDDATHRDAHRFGAVAILDKPFSMARLLGLVHQIAPDTAIAAPTHH